MDSNLNEIATCWSDIRLANDGPPEVALAALESLIRRYERAIRRYLLGACRDPDAADEVFQNFACRLASGGFRNADPARGRFRDLLRTSLRNLVSDYQRACKRATPPDHLARPIADPRQPDDEDDRRFLEVWLWDLLERTWDRLAAYETQSRRPLHCALRLRVEQPSLSSAGLTALQDRIGQPIDERQARKLLHYARRQYIAYLVLEVELTLENPSDEEVELELQSLGLLDRCRDYLRSRQGRRGSG